MSELVDAASASEFWGGVARCELHWFHAEKQAWLGDAGDGTWSGVTADGAATVESVKVSWTPWRACVDVSDAPCVRWFVGATTNAAFNELDRHVLRAHSEAAAIISDPGDGTHAGLPMRALLLESVLASRALIEFELVTGRRLALYVPNDLRAPVWIEAAKRLGVPFCAVAGGTASSSLADRVANTGAAVLLTTEGLAETAQEALALAAAVPHHCVGVLLPSSARAPRDEGAAAAAATTETATGERGGPNGDWRLAAAALKRARSRLLDACEQESVDAAAAEGSASPSALLARPLIHALWQLTSPNPVDASFPLFILYTSGSTGKVGTRDLHLGEGGACPSAAPVRLAPCPSPPLPLCSPSPRLSFSHPALALLVRVRILRTCMHLILPYVIASSMHPAAEGNRTYTWRLPGRPLPHHAPCVRRAASVGHLPCDCNARMDHWTELHDRRFAALSRALGSHRRFPGVAAGTLRRHH